MTEEFHDIAGFGELTDPEQLNLPRAQALVAAVREAADFTLMQLLSHTVPGVPRIEVLVVDVECDGVPSRNPAGIQYRERLALCVPEDPGSLVEVLAMRKSFPVLMHQNHGTRDGAASLCLYFEPTRTVMRTWTPQRFLRRIQWWLEQSAKGELHPVDQPVEHLFFASKYELVLPWNLDAIRATAGTKMAVARSKVRPDGGSTFFLRPGGNGGSWTAGSATLIELTLPPVVQGFVERDPSTLGGLADMLSHRGVQLLPPLIAALTEGVGSAGVPVGPAESFVVIVVYIPLVREVAGAVQQVSQRAFLVQGDVRKLGVKAGALYLLDKKYFVELQESMLARATATEWTSEPIFPMSVLQFPDSEAARKQSSVHAEGPRAALVGAGSLGSVMLNLWTRSGWGQWSVIDKDHVKPHNLVRHAAFSHHVGELKCDVVSELCEAATDGAATVMTVRGDACDVDVSAVKDALTAGSLVVDASAALEYPRHASFQDALPRHVTVFVTPSGNGAVLMFEDKARSMRLRTLEAQYYRALIQQEWGERHLEGNLGTYWSGASCRDISVAMPYSRIVVHASTLAEQVMSQAQSDEACIRVWERDSNTGKVLVHVVVPEIERHLDSTLR